MKKNMDCSLVKDLLALSMEGLTGEESERFLQMHLKECKKCQSFFKELVIENEEQKELECKKESAVLRSLKKWHYELLGLIIGIFTVLAFIVLVMGYAFFGNRDVEEVYSVKEHYEQVTDYGKQEYRGISELALFPESDEISGNLDVFYYDCKGNELYQSYQIYLECTYEEQAYVAEKERLLNIEDKKTGRKVVYSEEENKLPCVYAMLYDEGYEYALLSDEECKIRYIYLQGVDRREINFLQKYLPIDYGQGGYYFETEREAYRIYQTDEERMKEYE